MSLEFFEKRYGKVVHIGNTALLEKNIDVRTNNDSSLQPKLSWRSIRYVMRNRPGWELDDKELAVCEAYYRKETSGVRVGNLITYINDIRSLYESIKFHGRNARDTGVYNASANEYSIRSLEQDKSKMSSDELKLFEEAKALHNSLKLKNKVQ